MLLLDFLLLLWKYKIRHLFYEFCFELLKAMSHKGVHARVSKTLGEAKQYICLKKCSQGRDGAEM